jgi:hypothetical protein
MPSQPHPPPHHLDAPFYVRVRSWHLAAAGKADADTVALVGDGVAEPVEQPEPLAGVFGKCADADALDPRPEPKEVRLDPKLVPEGRLVRVVGALLVHARLGAPPARPASRVFFFFFFFFE